MEKGDCARDGAAAALVARASVDPLEPEGRKSVYCGAWGLHVQRHDIAKGGVGDA